MNSFETTYVLLTGLAAAWRMFMRMLGGESPPPAGGWPFESALADAVVIAVNFGLALWAGLMLFG